MVNLQPQAVHASRHGGGGVTEPSHTVIFQQLVESFGRGKPIEVIDFARVIENNIAFLREYPMGLYYPDFTERLHEMRLEQHAAVDQQAMAEGQQLDDEGYVFIDNSAVIPAAESSEIRLPPLFADLATADYALVWDLLLYLNRPEVTELSRQLAGSMRCGGQLYLINSTHAKISLEPMFCRIQDPSHILFLGCDEEERISPGYSQREITEMMPEFKLIKATLLQNGLQEMLLQKR